ncbi:S-layer protein [Levilactobacillus fujinensis]|uniref:S-layer protein n=1 Tax=Levilactobacillus fujinensis TaxID=2486024 RepID=A0ABW1TGL2_9LACO|nr:S-layer protein [Levilactobacillus fujinensis]
MKSRLAKSLYLGAAVLSFGAVANMSTTADAASKATIVSSTAIPNGSKNVEVTGTNAIYSKPGTVKGAKVVASKTMVKKLAESKNSTDYFRAYHMNVTNRGTVYYKIVSMNGKYRGYIYGGKVQGTIADGIKVAETTKTATVPTRTTGFHLKDVKKNTLWSAPKYTTYKAHKVSLYGSSKKDTFKVTKAETKTKEGSLYYYVTSTSNPSISGWVFAGEGYKDASSKDLGGLTLTTAEDEATNDNSVKIVYRNGSTQVGTATWITTTAKTKAGDVVNPTVAATKPAESKPDTSKTPAKKSAAVATVNGNSAITAKPITPAKSKEEVKLPTNVAGMTLAAFISGSAPSGYKLVQGESADTLANAATYGNTVYVNVEQAATSKVQLKVGEVNDKIDGAEVKVSGALKTGNALASADVKTTVGLSPAGISLLSGKKGQQMTTNLAGLSTELGKVQITGAKTFYASNGKAYHYTFTFSNKYFTGDNRLAVFGGNVTASFDATLTVGAVDNTSSNNNWMA